MNRYKSLAGFSIIDFAAAKISTPSRKFPKFRTGFLNFRILDMIAKKPTAMPSASFGIYWIIARKSSSLRIGIPSSLALRSLEPAFSPTTT